MQTAAEGQWMDGPPRDVLPRGTQAAAPAKEGARCYFSSSADPMAHALGAPPPHRKPQTAHGGAGRRHPHLRLGLRKLKARSDFNLTQDVSPVTEALFASGNPKLSCHLSERKPPQSRKHGAYGFEVKLKTTPLLPNCFQPHLTATTGRSCPPFY